MNRAISDKNFNANTMDVNGKVFIVNSDKTFNAEEGTSDTKEMSSEYNSTEAKSLGLSKLFSRKKLLRKSESKVR
jgi:hypothetical protein